LAEKAILYDATLCTGCRGCQVACKQWNECNEIGTPYLGQNGETSRFSYENPADLSTQTWLKIRFQESVSTDQTRFLFSRRSCMHCTNAYCVSQCRYGAVSHHADGFVTFDQSRCRGCEECEDCPFGVPHYGKNSTGANKMSKCTFCTAPSLDRLASGYEPACVKTCPPRALIYGDRAALVLEGRSRVSSLKVRNYPNAYLYGDRELGGLHILYVLSESPGTYGLPVNPQAEMEFEASSRNILSSPIVLGAGGLMLGLSMLAKRENTIKEKDSSGGPAKQT
jgi:formate dehydrogenase beta subunit